MNRDRPTDKALQVFAASCSGLERLADAIGRPIVLIDASLEPERTVDGLRARSHAGASRWESFQPLQPESGWNDWRLVKLEPGPDDAGTLPFGIEASFGVVYVPIPKPAMPEDFRGQLRGALRHLQLQSVTLQPSFLEESSDALRICVVQPRYTLADPFSFRGAMLVEDLYVLDPDQSFWRLFWSVVAARAATGEGEKASWR